MRLRWERRTWQMGLLAFVMVGVFVFLGWYFGKIGGYTEAVSLANFDPGYIISDYQMSNYKSMTEAEIQAFLTAKNPCNNTDYEFYVALSAGSAYKWHWENGHFVCLSEEKFGDGEVIGKGETAAHIIWRAAQDYRINPQALIVLLQKETGLITDPIPNDGDYRKAVGYGCPDTAPCSAEYYGLKNQIRHAAALFRTVLDGGWTNYPLGNNYVQYNPAYECGGGVVNIRSLATSALYRYTPYQPNAAALNAGYGYGDGCSAYGNRNFYLYFQDWFGGITDEKTILGSYNNMVSPRLMFVKAGARYVEPATGQFYVRKGASFEYFAYSNTQGEAKNLCLAIKNDANCYLYADLEEINAGKVMAIEVPRVLTVNATTKYIDAVNKKFGETVEGGSDIVFQYKVSVNGKLCLMETEKSDCILYDSLKELPTPVFSKMVVARNFYVKAGTTVVNAKTGLKKETGEDKKIYFNTTTSWKGKLCLYADELGDNTCILYNDLVELKHPNVEKMAQARSLMVRTNVMVDIETGKEVANKMGEEVVYFTKRTSVNGKLCLQSEKMATDQCIYYENLAEIPNYSRMAQARSLITARETYYYNTLTRKKGERVDGGTTLEFDEKTMVDGRLCLRTKSATAAGESSCIFYANLLEK